MNNLTNNIVNSDKMFYIYSSELEGRLDPFYYQPSIRELENKVRKKSSKKLRSYISKISSGATPSVQEEDKYYSDKENGIPFLRVQNLQTNGKINLEDVKYINKETHDKLLKRSQVAEHDLLVKITGVGRMAIASVAPDNFVGNTNQHMVVIKTDNKVTSEYLSSYLNLDFVERLASRRATGGTRPALDYPALKSIPIIENIDFTRIVEAEKQKDLKEKEAKELLASINDYLLNELGISIPKRDNSLEARIFSVNFNEISGSRFDPNYIKQMEMLNYTSIFPFVKLSDIAMMYQPQTITQQEMLIGGKYKVFGANGHIGFYHKYNHDYPEVLVTCRGATCGEINMSEPKSWITGNAMVVHLTIKNMSKIYLYEILKCLNLESIITGSAQPQITRENLKQFRVPLPPLEKQTEMTIYIKNIRDKAKQIQEEANNILDQAKIDLQNSLLN